MLEEFEDTKVLIRIRKSRNDRQHDGQKNKQRSTKQRLKTKDRVTRTPLIVFIYFIWCFVGVDLSDIMFCPLVFIFYISIFLHM